MQMQVIFVDTRQWGRPCVSLFFSSVCPSVILRTSECSCQYYMMRLRAPLNIIVVLWYVTWFPHLYSLSHIMVMFVLGISRRAGLSLTACTDIQGFVHTHIRDFFGAFTHNGLFYLTCDLHRRCNFMHRPNQKLPIPLNILLLPIMQHVCDRK